MGVQVLLVSSAAASSLGSYTEVEAACIAPPISRAHERDGSPDRNEKTP
jgi:hypothetical protein